MQPLSNKKRKSDQISMAGDDQYAVDMTSQKIPTKGGSPHPQESPSKRQRVGITLAQKQALIDNLQLESMSSAQRGVDDATLTLAAVTERARKLRANYNIHAQSLRTRIEIRVNRIPLSLRKLTMGELMDKYSTEQQQKPSATTGTARGPPVPAKDKAPSRPPTRGTIAPPSARPTKRQRFVALALHQHVFVLTLTTVMKSRAATRRTRSKPPKRRSAQTRQRTPRATRPTPSPRPPPTPGSRRGRSQHQVGRA